jgi:outer membrane protein assembly factor BamB
MYFGSEVVALSPADGAVQWRVELTAAYNFTSGPPARLPLVRADGRLIVGLDGTLRAFDAASGDERWTVRGVGVRPVATGGVVSTGTVGLDLEDGSVRWRFQSSDSVSPPSVVDNTVYVGSDDTYLYALAANAGTVEWAGRTDGPVRAAPAVGEDAVYVGTLDGTLHAFDREDGSERWQFDVGGQVQPPALYDGTVYVGNFSPTITAVDAATGTERWRTRADRDQGGQQFIALELAVDEGAVYTGANGDVRAFDASTGEQRWRVTHGEDAVVQSPPAVGEGLVFVNVGPELRAFDPADGTEHWTGRTGSTNRPPVVREGTVYSSGADAVYAFDATDGSRRWKQRVGGEVALAAGDRAVYGLGYDTPLVALDPGDGSELWQHGDRRLLTPPAIAGEYLFVGDDTGTVHGFGPASR